MQNINGIPIVRVADVIKPVLTRYCRSEEDLAIRVDILSDLRSAISSDDLVLLRRFLSQEESFWIGNLQWAYFQKFEGIDPLDGYEDWARSKCDILTAIARKTRDDDAIIQHLVNYEDFYVEVLPFLPNKALHWTLIPLRSISASELWR
jgi:hypothetical protein